MTLDLLALGAFLVSATALLGSPGPGIAALVAVGRAEGLSRGLRYYAGLQLGLAVAAGVTAVGVASVLQAVPMAMTTLTFTATAYLVYLAYRIATAPVGATAGKQAIATSPMAGVLLGIANPKAYMAFASLFTSRAIASPGSEVDVALKWVLCVAVILAVDFAWLLAGAALHRTAFPPESERMLNRVLGAAILIAAGVALL